MKFCAYMTQQQHFQAAEGLVVSAALKSQLVPSYKRTRSHYVGKCTGAKYYYDDILNVKDVVHLSAKDTVVDQNLYVNIITADTIGLWRHYSFFS